MTTRHASVEASSDDPSDDAAEVASGRPLPLGCTRAGEGFNFAIVSENATRVTLLLFRRGEVGAPERRIDLAPERHRSGAVWHVWVRGVDTGSGYAFEVDGPWAPEAGHRFDARKRLLDPYARALANPWWDAVPETGASPDPRWNDGVGVVVGEDFDWGSDRPPRTPWTDTIVYEAHVRGLTIHPSASVAHPGTFLGLIEKIPHLRALGVTAIELLPVHDFNPRELTLRDPTSGKWLRNYWGYSPVGWAAPAEGYGTRREPGVQVNELKSMVRELHCAGIEVILDVVFNHSAEIDETGPTLQLRGLDNSIYYGLEENRSRYRNHSGCGNVLDAGQAVVQDLIVDSLRTWVIDFHVDGFRFDLTSILARDREGRLLDRAPLLERIAGDPVLAGVKLIAEPWDAGGGYQVGGLADGRWREWNDHFRDDVRRFWRGDPATRAALATRLCGSADLYAASGFPTSSINFITCHDGFTLADLVSYDHKHNLANGQDGRDGAGENFSSSYGVEGPTADPALDALRMRQSKNLLATLLLSRGVPMLLAGDEMRRTQQGNNNAYCQDNEISWTDWRLLERDRELERFVRAMIALRRRHPILSRDAFYAPADVTWFGPDGVFPDWGAPEPVLGALLHPQGEQDRALCLLFNASPTDQRFRIPAAASGAAWRVIVETGAAAPRDVIEAPRSGNPLDDPALCPLIARSLTVLEAAPAGLVRPGRAVGRAVGEAGVSPPKPASSTAR